MWVNDVKFSFWYVRNMRKFSHFWTKNIWLLLRDIQLLFWIKKIYIYTFWIINSFDNSCLLFHYCSSARYFSGESLLVESKLGKRVKKPTGYMPNAKRRVVDWISKLCEVCYSRMQIGSGSWGEEILKFQHFEYWIFNESWNLRIDSWNLRLILEI